ncbi:MAG: carbamoyltransferase C-terminal domain-containing protein [Patescibacteria group bacterium]
MNILGVKVTSHDTGAAVLAGARIVAIAEERLNRVKHSKNMFPRLAIDYCLKEAGLADGDIDMIVLDQVGYRNEVPSDRIFMENMKGRFAGVPIHIINHHDAHAASAFFASPFEESAVMVADGSGEKRKNYLGVIGTETETLYRGSGNKLIEIQKTIHQRRRRAFRHSMGIGKLYTFICEAYLSLGAYNEGKMMGLAPYGDDRVLREFPLERWFAEVDGHLICNANITFPGAEKYLEGRKVDSPFSARIKERLEDVAFAIISFVSGGRKEFFERPSHFTEINLRQPARGAKDPLPDPYYASVAYAAQKVLEEVMVRLGKRLRAVTGSDNLCLAGGVGLNIDANRRFLEDVEFKHLFVQPAASDTGIALGCVLYGAHMIAGLPRFWRMSNVALGRPYGEVEIEAALKAYADKIVVTRPTDIAEVAATHVANSKIVGWFSGGAEYGPRALGHRSILCDARNPEMANIANKKVKFREPWRPFAASVLAERQSAWFALEHPSPFMLLAAQVLPEKRSQVPSIVHVDGSCRIQSVTQESNERYYRFLQAFERQTSVPLVLNTSFNLAGEPIVETPAEAIRCFLASGMEYLVLENCILEKRPTA